MGTTIMEKTIATTGREVHLSKVILLFCLPILFFSCNTKDVYHTFNHIPERGWDKRVIERFSPVIEDTISTYDIDLSLRYTNDYNYRNLWLFYKSDFNFPRKGRYSISVQQGMRDDVIPGITEVGIKITPATSVAGE